MLEKLKREGFVRARVDGEILELAGQQPLMKLPRGQEHVIEAVVDRLVIRDGVRQRLADSVDTALKWGSQQLVVLLREEAGDQENWREIRYSTDFSNPEDRLHAARPHAAPFLASTATSARARSATASAPSCWSIPS